MQIIKIKSNTHNAEAFKGQFISNKEHFRLDAIAYLRGYSGKDAVDLVMDTTEISLDGGGDENVENW